MRGPQCVYNMLCWLEENHVPHHTLVTLTPPTYSGAFVLDDLWFIPVFLASSLHQLFLLPTIPQSLSKPFNSCNTFMGERTLLGDFWFTGSLVNNQSVWQEGTPTNMTGNQLALGTYPSSFI